MDKELEKLVEQVAEQRRLIRERDESVKREQARVSEREKELLPRKLEMAEDIFRWGRDILANEDYKFVRELGVKDGLGPGLRIYSATSGEDYGLGVHSWSRLILTDDGAFHYTKGYKFSPLDSFGVPDPEFLAESFMYRYVSDLHESTTMGVERAVSKVTHWYSDEIRWRLEKQDG